MSSSLAVFAILCDIFLLTLPAESDEYAFLWTAIRCTWLVDISLWAIGISMIINLLVSNRIEKIDQRLEFPDDSMNPT